MINLWLRGISVLVLGCYMGTQVVFAYSPEGSLWDQRRREQRRRSTVSKDGLLAWNSTGGAGQISQFLPSALSRGALESSLISSGRSVPVSGSGFEGLLAVLPAQNVSVRKIARPKQGPLRGVIVYLQDIHRNHESQSNLARALFELLSAKAVRVSLVALEGAFAAYDLSYLRAFPDREAARIAAEELLYRHRLSGPMFSLLTHPSAIPAVAGVDDASHYTANVEAYRRASPRQAELKAQTAAMGRVLEGRKDRDFNADLRRFDRRIQDYHEGKIPLSAYAKVLAEGTTPPTGPLADFLAAVTLEETLDFSQVEAERTALLRRLSETLTRDQTEALISQSVAYRAGSLSYTDFHRWLESLCRTAGVPLADFPAMKAYVRYVLQAEGLDAETLFRALIERERMMYATLAKTAKEKQLIRNSRMLNLEVKLIDFALTPEEWAEYDAGRTDSIPSPDLESFEAFYREALARDVAMARNLLKSMATSAAGETTTAVLVTGGYHSPGLTARLTEAGYTVVSVVPKIQKIETEQGSAYLSVFAQEKTPLDKLFSGSKLFLAEDPLSPAAAGELQLTAGAVSLRAGTLLPEVKNHLASQFDDLKPRVERDRTGLGATYRGQHLRATYYSQSTAGSRTRLDEETRTLSEGLSSVLASLRIFANRMARWAVPILFFGLLIGSASGKVKGPLLNSVVQPKEKEPRPGLPSVLSKPSFWRGVAALGFVWLGFDAGLVEALPFLDGDALTGLGAAGGLWALAGISVPQHVGSANDEKGRFESLMDIPKEQLRGMTVFVRTVLDDTQLDYDDMRMVLAAKTVRYLSRAGAKVVLLTHLGRPTGYDHHYTINSRAGHLGFMLDQDQEKYQHEEGPIRILPGETVDGRFRWLSDSDKAAIRSLQEGEIVMLQNTRFDSRENGNLKARKGMVRELAVLADNALFVADGFPIMHRPGTATLEDLAEALPGVKGPWQVMEERAHEKFYARLKNIPERGKLTVIFGGGKPDKEYEIGAFCRAHLISGDTLVLGGIFADRLISEELKRTLKAMGIRIILPDSSERIRDAKGVVQDVGPRFTQSVLAEIASAHTLFWEGPLGRYKFEEANSLAVARFIAGWAREDSQRQAFVSGGSTSLLFKSAMQWTEQDRHQIPNLTISTGGGTSIYYFGHEGRLPGTDKLQGYVPGEYFNPKAVSSIDERIPKTIYGIPLVVGYPFTGEFQNQLGRWIDSVQAMVGPVHSIHSKSHISIAGFLLTGARPIEQADIDGLPWTVINGAMAEPGTGNIVFDKLSVGRDGNVFLEGQLSGPLVEMRRKLQQAGLLLYDADRVHITLCHIGLETIKGLTPDQLHSLLSWAEAETRALIATPLTLTIESGIFVHHASYDGLKTISQTAPIPLNGSRSDLKEKLYALLTSRSQQKSKPFNAAARFLAGILWLLTVPVLLGAGFDVRGFSEAGYLFLGAAVYALLIGSANVKDALFSGLARRLTGGANGEIDPKRVAEARARLGLLDEERLEIVSQSEMNRKGVAGQGNTLTRGYYGLTTYDAEGNPDATYVSDWLFRPVKGRLAAWIQHHVLRSVLDRERERRLGSLRRHSFVIDLLRPFRIVFQTIQKKKFALKTILVGLMMAMNSSTPSFAHQFQTEGSSVSVVVETYAKQSAPRNLLWGIAEDVAMRNNLPSTPVELRRIISEFQKANPELVNPDQVSPGQRLIVPDQFSPPWLSAESIKKTGFEDQSRDRLEGRDDSKVKTVVIESEKFTELISGIAGFRFGEGLTLFILSLMLPLLFLRAWTVRTPEDDIRRLKAAKGWFGKMGIHLSIVWKMAWEHRTNVKGFFLSSALFHMGMLALGFIFVTPFVRDFWLAFEQGDGPAELSIAWTVLGLLYLMAYALFYFSAIATSLASFILWVEEIGKRWPIKGALSPLKTPLRTIHRYTLKPLAAYLKGRWERAQRMMEGFPLAYRLLISNLGAGFILLPIARVVLFPVFLLVLGLLNSFLAEMAGMFFVPALGLFMAGIFVFDLPKILGLIRNPLKERTQALAADARRWRSAPVGWSMKTMAWMNVAPVKYAILLSVRFALFFLVLGLMGDPAYGFSITFREGDIDVDMGDLKDLLDAFIPYWVGIAGQRAAEQGLSVGLIKMGKKAESDNPFRFTPPDIVVTKQHNGTEFPNYMGQVMFEIQSLVSNLQKAESSLTPKLIEEFVAHLQIRAGKPGNKGSVYRKQMPWGWALKKKLSSGDRMHIAVEVKTDSAGRSRVSRIVLGPIASNGQAHQSDFYKHSFLEMDSLSDDLIDSSRRIDPPNPADDGFITAVGRWGDRLATEFGQFLNNPESDIVSLSEKLKEWLALESSHSGVLDQRSIVVRRIDQFLEKARISDSRGAISEIAFKEIQDQYGESVKLFQGKLRQLLGLWERVRADSVVIAGLTEPNNPVQLEALKQVLNNYEVLGSAYVIERLKKAVNENHLVAVWDESNGGQDSLLSRYLMDQEVSASEETAWRWRWVRRINDYLIAPGYETALFFLVPFLMFGLSGLAWGGAALVLLHGWDDYAAGRERGLQPRGAVYGALTAFIPRMVRVAILYAGPFALPLLIPELAETFAWTGLFFDPLEKAAAFLGDSLDRSFMVVTGFHSLWNLIDAVRRSSAREKRTSTAPQVETKPVRSELISAVSLFAVLFLLLSAVDQPFFIQSSHTGIWLLDHGWWMALGIVWVAVGGGLAYAIGGRAKSAEQVDDIDRLMVSGLPHELVGTLLTEAATRTEFNAVALRANLHLWAPWRKYDYIQSMEHIVAFSRRQGLAERTDLLLVFRQAIASVQNSREPIQPFWLEGVARMDGHRFSKVFLGQARRVRNDLEVEQQEMFDRLNKSFPVTNSKVIDSLDPRSLPLGLLRNVGEDFRHPVYEAEFGESLNEGIRDAGETLTPIPTLSEGITRLRDFVAGTSPSKGADPTSLAEASEKKAQIVEIHICSEADLNLVRDNIRLLNALNAKSNDKVFLLLMGATQRAVADLSDLAKDQPFVIVGEAPVGDKELNLAAANNNFVGMRAALNLQGNLALAVSVSEGISVTERDLDSLDNWDPTLREALLRYLQVLPLTVTDFHTMLEILTRLGSNA